MRRFLGIIFSIFLLQHANAQLIGLCIDTTNAPISGVQIYEKTLGTKMGQSKIDGYFKLELKAGIYKLVFSHPEFYNQEVAIVVEDKFKDTITVILVRQINQINAVLVKAKWKDPGPDYMRKAIARRQIWAKRIPAQSADVYIRAFEDLTIRKTPAQLAAEAENETNATDPKEEETSGNFVEITMKRDWSPPNKIKEVKQGVSLRGDKSGLFYLSTVEGDFNIFQNLMNLPGLCPLPVMSPLSSSAILAYRFRFIESYNHPVSGEIHLVDTSFYVAKIVLNVPKHLMAEYEEMTLTQNYRITKDSNILIDSQRFNYLIRNGSFKSKGETKVIYSNIVPNPTFPKNHFGLELSKVEQDAYEKDTAFWAQKRQVPLTLIERTFINKLDSIKRAHSSDVYLDSLEKIANKSIVLEGQEYQNRRKGLNLQFQPLMFIWQPWWPGGSRITLFNRIVKTFENKKEINFNENLSYGLNNKDLRGTIAFSTLYNPYKRKVIYASVGRDFGFVNPFAAYIDLFRRDNFYQHDHVSVYHRQEIVNGLFFRVRGEFSDRKDISYFKFSSTGDSLFENNTPLKFNAHRSLFADITLSYTPFQRYLSEPKQKIILGSTWPTFVIDYRRAVPGIFNSTIDYQYLEYRIEHDFPWGLFGKSELRATSGAFLSHKNINVIDYRYQRRGDASIFTPPMYAFQMLDSTFKTFKRYYEVHYRHHFYGSLLNKIPLVKKLNLYESVGMSMLYAPERRNMMYYEMYFGIDKLVKIWRDRFKIGIFYCVGYSNLFDAPRTAFKINFEFYDRSSNSW